MTANSHEKCHLYTRTAGKKKGKHMYLHTVVGSYFLSITFHRNTGSLQRGIFQGRRVRHGRMQYIRKAIQY